MDEMMKINYIDNINANNYLRDLKSLYEVMKPRKKQWIMGRVAIIGLIVVILLTIVNPPKSTETFFLALFAIQILFAAAIMCPLAANIDRMNVRSILKQTEKDISSANYVTRKIVYGSGEPSYFMRRLSEKERANLKKSFAPMLMYDARNDAQSYKFNGSVGQDAPFEYGMILEITYLGKSKVINRVSIVQEA